MGRCRVVCGSSVDRAVAGLYFLAESATRQFTGPLASLMLTAVGARLNETQVAVLRSAPSRHRHRRRARVREKRNPGDVAEARDRSGVYVN